MLKEIKLTNFQSHRRSVLPLRPGLNVITGPSDTGKSAVVRGLRFLALHETATGLTTNGESEMSVRVIADGPNVIADGPNVIERFKDTRGYGYQLNDLPKFLACARDQPLPIATVLNLTETNFQSQHDPHFLLSLTPGQVAREINKIVSLEDIDRAISWLKERSKQNNILLEATEQELTGFEAYLEANKHIPRMGDMLTLLQIEADTITRLADAINDLGLHTWELVQLRGSGTALVQLSAACDSALEAGRKLQATKATKQDLESLVAETKAVAALSTLEAAGAALEGLVACRRQRRALEADFLEVGKQTLEIVQQKSRISDTLRQSCAKILAQPTNSSRIRDLVNQYEEYENEVTKYRITERKLEQVLAERATCSQCGRKL